MEYDNVSFEGNTWVDKKPHLVPFPLGTLQIRLVYPPSILSTQTYSSTYWDQLPCVTQDTTDPVFIQFFVKCVNSEFSTPEQKSIWPLKLEDRTTLSVTLRVSILFLFRAKSAGNLTQARRQLSAHAQVVLNKYAVRVQQRIRRGESPECVIPVSLAQHPDLMKCIWTWWHESACSPAGPSDYPSLCIWFWPVVLRSFGFSSIFIGSVKMCIHSSC